MSHLTKVRKVKPTEIIFETFQREFSVMITSCWLKLETSQRLKGTQVEEAFRILYRNVDILSFCLQEEGEDTWFCKMEKEKINFEVLENKAPSDVLNEEIHTSFNSKEGPLWRVKFIPNSDSEEDKEDREVEHQDNPLSDPTLQKSCHFLSDVILSFNHVMTDGFTVFNICGSFLKVLNDVVGGTIESWYNFGKFCDASETDELTIKREELFKNNLEIFEKVKSEIEEINSENTILGDIFSAPNDVINKTKHIHRDLNKEMTSKLIKIFKDNGVSFHSGFTALTNWALIDVLKENGYSSDSLNISAFHTINMRRYWKESSEVQLGCNVGSITMKTKTETDVGDRFWDYAQEIHDLLKKHISECRTIDENILATVIFEQMLDNADLIKNPSTPKLYYSTTNMGDVSSFLKGQRHVKINWLTRCTSAHCGHTCCTHITQTFEGKFLYGLGYYTKSINDEFAQKYVDKIFDKIYLLIN